MILSWKIILLDIKLIFIKNPLNFYLLIAENHFSCLFIHAFYDRQ